MVGVRQLAHCPKEGVEAIDKWRGRPPSNSDPNADKRWLESRAGAGGYLTHETYVHHEWVELDKGW